MKPWERDDVWGWVLIAAGAAGILWRPWERITARLHGTPDLALSAMLVLVAIAAVWAAARSTPRVKAMMLSWMVLP